MDELQNLWATHSDSAINDQQLDETELNNQLIDKANSAIRHVNHVMRIDALVMIATTFLFIAVTFMMNLESKYLVSLLLLCMMMFLGMHYWVKHTLLNKHDFKNESITSILIKKMKYLRLYKRIYTYAIPAIFLGLYIYLQTILLQISLESIDVNVLILLRYSLGIPAAFLIYLLTKSLYKWLFGKEMETIKNIIKELN